MCDGVSECPLVEGLTIGNTEHIQARIEYWFYNKNTHANVRAMWPFASTVRCRYSILVYAHSFKNVRTTLEKSRQLT